MTVINSATEVVEIELPRLQAKASKKTGIGVSEQRPRRYHNQENQQSHICCITGTPTCISFSSLGSNFSPISLLPPVGDQCFPFRHFVLK
jgi:hypothetical protein